MTQVRDRLITSNFSTAYKPQSKAVSQMAFARRPAITPQLATTGLSANRVFWRTDIQTGRSPVPLDSVCIRGSVPSSELRRGREGTESARAPRRLHGTAWRKYGAGHAEQGVPDRGAEHTA